MAAHKLAIVTGANSGYGYHATRLLLARGVDVVMACRSAALAESAVKQLQAAQDKNAGIATVMALDLADLASVAAFAAAFEERFGTRKLDYLLLTRASCSSPAMYQPKAWS